MRKFAAYVAIAAVVAFASTGVQGSSEFRLLRLNGHYVKWGDPDLGTGATVRYALVTNPMHFPDARNCAAMGPLAPLARAAAIPPSQLKSEIAAAFALWQAAADITFAASDDPATADILIGTQEAPRGWAFADVLYDPAGEGKVRPIDRALICLSPEKPWKVGFGGDPEAYDLRYVIAHEIGHAIGLNHPGPNGQVMSFEYGEDFRTLQAGDVNGAVALYGQRGAPLAETPPDAAGDEAPDMALQGRSNDPAPRR